MSMPSRPMSSSSCRSARLRAGARAGRALEGDPALARGRRRAVPARDRRRGHVGQSDRRCGHGARARRRRARCAACRSSVAIKRGDGPRVIENLVADTAGDVDLRVMAETARSLRAPIRCAWSRARRCGATGATCTARAARPSARLRRKTISATRATRRSSTSSATRATTSRSPTRSGRSSIG